MLVLLLCLPLLAQTSPYLLILGIDVLIAVIFATSLHFIMGPGGMHSFGHAAYFGLGAYGAALLVKWLAVPMGRRVDRGAAGRSCRRVVVRLVRGAAFRRLSRDADARLRADRLGIGVPVGDADWRLQWRDRRLASAAFRQSLGLFPAHAGARRDRGAAVAALSVCAVRLRHARGSRFRLCAQRLSAST